MSDEGNINNTARTYERVQSYMYKPEQWEDKLPAAWAADIHCVKNRECEIASQCNFGYYMRMDDF